jgi:tetratricopeptide (TPR) repeat protein
MTALVDSSLLQVEEQHTEPRYTMLATIQEFALEQLAEHSEEPATRDRHAHYFQGFVERRGAEIVAIVPAVLDEIDREHGNLRAALAWSRQTGDHETLLCLAADLAFFWYWRGYLAEGQRWLDLALQTPDDAATTRPRAWAMTLNGMLAQIRGDPVRATALLTESIAWWEQTGQAYGRAFAKMLLGGVYLGHGRYDEAAPLFTANEAVFRKTGHEDDLALTHFHLGLLAWVHGDVVRALHLLRESVARFDRIAMAMHSIDPLRYLGLIAVSTGELEEAVTWFREEWTRLRLRGSRAALAVGMADVATLAAAREAWHPAARLFARAETLAQTEGAAFSLPAREHYERARDQARAALGAAASEVTAAGRALTLEQALAEAEAVLALDHSSTVGSSSDGG